MARKQVLFTVLGVVWTALCSAQNAAYGTTVIVHGFNTADNVPPWAFDMAKAIQISAGKGKIFLYNRSSGTFIDQGGNAGGENILIFDWAQESNENIKGYTEAAGDALFAALIQGMNVFSLKNLHFIGHSRGTVVVTEAVERLLVLKQQDAFYKNAISIDQVTNLDPHDWGSMNLVSDMDDNNPDISIDHPVAYRPNNGAIAWKGVSFYDNYWQFNEEEDCKGWGAILNLYGREMVGAVNHLWNNNDLGEILCHTNIHEAGYTRTIKSPGIKMEGGYKYSRVKNGFNSRPPFTYQRHPLHFDFFERQMIPSSGSGRVMGIVNGSFDRGEKFDIPGWNKHGGGGKGQIAQSSGKSCMLLSSEYSYKTHNRMFIPKEAKSISFLLNAYQPNEKSVLVIKLGAKEIYKDTLKNATYGFVHKTSLDISSFGGQVATLDVRISSGVPCVIYLTDFEFSKNANNAVTSTTLLLFDVSGSMNDNNKIGQARQSAKTTLNTIRQESQQSGLTPEIGLMVFSGGCVPDPTKVIQPFTTNLAQVESSIEQFIRSPNGGTPLPQAVEQAQKLLEYQLQQRGQTCGNLIILGDGQSSCGNVRPPNAFAGSKTINICANITAGKTVLKFYTIGFGIAPGSVAELDLQYLANSTGGKYFNAKDEYQLTRAFQKISRIYRPIAIPQTHNVSSSLAGVFQAGINFIYTEQYDTALTLFAKFVAAYSTDSAGLYNLALMNEANERYKPAANYYELYLQQAPNDPNKTAILERITTLKKDHEIFIAYMKEFLISDLEYLNRHYQQLLKTPDAVPLSGEFAAFIREKQNFYKYLPEALDIKETWLSQYCREISQAFRQSAYFLSKSPKQWDMDGISMLGNIYYPMEKLVNKIKQL